MPSPKFINLASLARTHTATCIRALAGYARNKNPAEVPPEVRIKAIEMLLDRGWGKTPQPHTGADGEGDLRLTVRHIVEAVGTNGQVVDVVPQQLAAPEDPEPLQ